MKYFSAKYCALYFLAAIVFIFISSVYIIYHDFNRFDANTVVYGLLMSLPLALFAIVYFFIAKYAKQGRHWINCFHTLPTIILYCFFVTMTYASKDKSEPLPPAVVNAGLAMMGGLLFTQIVTLVFIVSYKNKA